LLRRKQLKAEEKAKKFYANMFGKMEKSTKDAGTSNASTNTTQEKETSQSNTTTDIEEQD
jgi:hypothetical protein